MRSILTTLRRGVSKRCPHCGEGPIFSGWAHHLEACPVCGLVYDRNPGDTWAFTIVLIYFGFGRTLYLWRRVWPDPSDPLPATPFRL